MSNMTIRIKNIFRHLYNVTYAPVMDYFYPLPPAPAPDPTIHSLPELRKYINKLPNVALVNTLYNAALGNNNCTLFPTIQDWAATAKHHESAFTNSIYVEAINRLNAAPLHINMKN
jgi:hypothetical protein